MDLLSLARPDASPALRALLGFLGEQGRFILSREQIQPVLDNGAEPVLKCDRVHWMGDDAHNDLRLVDLEGDVWVVSEAGAQPLVPCSASAAEAEKALRDLWKPAFQAVA